MSGIYIPGMEMPKNCFDCPLFDDVYTDADGDDDYSCGLGVPLDYYQASGGNQKDCPLVPVPEHGRLIDADALRYWSDDSAMIAFDYVTRSQINAAPTIIQASEEGET